MAECHNCNESSSTRSIYPALAVAALAGLAITYFFVKKQRSVDAPLPIDKVVNICNSAAEKLDAFANRALAS